MQKVDKEKTRYYLAKIHILLRGNFRTQERPRLEGLSPVLLTALLFAII